MCCKLRQSLVLLQAIGSYVIDIFECVSTSKFSSQCDNSHLWPCPPFPILGFRPRWCACQLDASACPYEEPLGLYRSPLRPGARGR